MYTSGCISSNFASRFFIWLTVFVVSYVVGNTKDPNQVNELFLSKFVFPEKFIKQNIKTKVWITKGIKISFNTKRNLYKRRIHGEVSEVYYKNYCRILKNVISEAKRRTNIAYISLANNKGKAVWDLVKNYTGTKIDYNNSNSILKNIDTQQTNKHTVLNNVNNFFVNVCPCINSNTHMANNLKYSQKNIFLSLTCPEEVCNVIKNLKNKVYRGR